MDTGDEMSEQPKRMINCKMCRGKGKYAERVPSKVGGCARSYRPGGWFWFPCFICKGTGKVEKGFCD